MTNPRILFLALLILVVPTLNAAEDRSSPPAEPVGYTLMGSTGDTITFQIPSLTPPPKQCLAHPPNCFAVSPVVVTFNGFPTYGLEIEFFASAEGGGLGIEHGNEDPEYVNTGGSVLFSGTIQNPTLFTGTFDLATDNCCGALYTDPTWVLTVGTGIEFAPGSLTFATQLVQTKSKLKTIRLTNISNVTLNITGIRATGDFLQQNSCPASLPAGDHCFIDVVFVPQAKGLRNGRLFVFDDFPGSPQQVPLKGTGTIVKLSPVSLDFGDQMVGTKSSPLPVRMTNKGKTAVNIQQIKITGSDSGDFSQSNDCGTMLPAGKSCTISVTFAPTQKGLRSANVSISDDGGGSPQLVLLTGMGT